MHKHIIGVALLALTLLPYSAYAADESKPPEEVTFKNPWLASGLALPATMLLWTASVPAFGVAAPLGVGAGHFYAGDVTRGAWVSLGGVGAFLAGGAWGLYGPNSDLYPRRVNNAVFGALTATAAYSLWASWDAYQTAERINQQR
jgi:hypothetical protein